MSVGYLEIILGSMFSGKTTRLAETWKRCKQEEEHVLVISHQFDNRYGVTDGQISTHNGVVVPCIKTDKLTSLRSNIHKDVFVILIDEAQFFPDLLTFVKWLLMQEKRVCLWIRRGFSTKKNGTTIRLNSLV